MKRKPSEIFDQAVLAGDPAVKALIQAAQDRLDVDLQDAKAEVAALQAEAKRKGDLEKDLRTQLQTAKDRIPDEFLLANGLTPEDLSGKEKNFFALNGLKPGDLERDQGGDSFLKANGLPDDFGKDQGGEDSFLKANRLRKEDLITA